ncbi:protein kinase domain-containing protein [Halapricum desulfuricans]|uniref:Membrane associated serine/threonine protein kinase n=1 Tax=Halapricum desulfuricans TaxID=2841257 RepID=A0A897NQY3_9EURY|nr:protein kinase [Halapricum desulfuricans]QSG15188.1 Membrane associated serine/threonine protein kinase [Halapricum desulfuricans]
MSSADSEAVRTMLADIIADPERGQQALPRLVGRLDSDDRTVRIGAACGLCLIASEDPGSVEYTVRRLVDRLDDDVARPESILALEYLMTQFPERVDETLQELREQRDEEPLQYTRQGGFVRSGYFQPGEPSRDDVGRVRHPGGADSGSGLVYGQADERGDERAPGWENSDENSQSEPGSDTDEEAPGGSSETARQRVKRLHERVESIVEQSRFDQLMVLTGEVPGRYAHAYPVLATHGGREQALSLRLFYQPTENRQTFQRRLAGAIEQWGRIDHEHVVSLYDSGTRPEPWVASQHVEATLRAGLPDWNVSEIVGTVARLADGLATLHQRDIVHGGIDPESVAVELETEAGQRARLDNIGLLTVYRWFVDPSTCLDPRFAAPEYFDASFGGVDQATDIYQLGAILYYLLAGEPPYDGSYADVRTRVPGETRPTPPSEAAAVPAFLDGIVSKALARQKLTRYETAVAFQQDLLDARERI